MKRQRDLPAPPNRFINISVTLPVDIENILITPDGNVTFTQSLMISVCRFTDGESIMDFKIFLKVIYISVPLKLLISVPSFELLVFIVSQCQ